MAATVAATTTTLPMLLCLTRSKDQTPLHLPLFVFTIPYPQEQKFSFKEVAWNPVSMTLGQVTMTQKWDESTQKGSTSTTGTTGTTGSLHRSYSEET